MRCRATTVLPVPGPPSTTSAPRDPARMMASWSAWIVPSTSRIRADRLLPEAGDERGLVVEGGGVPLEPVRGEHLVPVVADPAAGPAVAAAADQAHRVGVGGAEERLGGGGAPVDEQPTAGAVGEAEAADVDRLGAVGADDATEAQVQPEAAQRPQPRGQPVDLQVPVQRLPGPAPPGALRSASSRGGQVGRSTRSSVSARAAKCCSSPRDQGGVGLGGKGGREGRMRWWSRGSRISSCCDRRWWARAGDSAARWGPCRKPPGALYVEVEGRALRLVVHCGRKVPPRTDAPRVPVGGWIRSVGVPLVSGYVCAPVSGAET